VALLHQRHHLITSLCRCSSPDRGGYHGEDSLGLLGAGFIGDTGSRRLSPQCDDNSRDGGGWKPLLSRQRVPGSILCFSQAESGRGQAPHP
jgi:hypothetical protein